MRNSGIFTKDEDGVSGRAHRRSFFLCVFVVVFLAVFAIIASYSHARNLSERMQLARVDCVLNENCEPVCGDGEVDAPEQCEGTGTMAGVTCESLGYAPGGTVECVACQIVPNCVAAIPTPTPTPNPAVCNNGILDDGEQCDGPLIREGVTCASIGGYGDRVPTCMPDCMIDLCSCGDELTYPPACLGATFCEEQASTEEECATFPSCSWVTGDIEDGYGGYVEASFCSGIFDCEITKEHPDCLAWCHERKGIHACAGPEILCGEVGDVFIDNSGMMCSATLTCEPYFNTAYGGTNFCEYGVYLVDSPNEEYGSFIVYHATYTTGDFTDLYVRKILKELPYSPE